MEPSPGVEVRDLLYRQPLGRLEIRALLDLGGPGKASCAEVREIAAHHLEDIRAKIVDLRKLEHLLATTIAKCSGKKVPDCPVIDILDAQRTKYDLSSHQCAIHAAAQKPDKCRQHDRRDKAVETVEQPAMAGNDVAGVFDAEPPLYCRFKEIAEL